MAGITKRATRQPAEENRLMGSTGTTDSAAVAGVAARAFADAYGRQPDVTWSAPGRANLIGEHTDYNDGFVLPFAITQRTAVAAAGRDDGIIRSVPPSRPGTVAVRAADIAPGAVDGWARYPLGVAWALARVRDVPDGAGADLFIHFGRPGRRGSFLPRRRSRSRRPARSPRCGGWS